MKNKPSILIVSSWYPSIGQPTNGSFVHEQVKMLQKNGHEVIVLKPNLNGTFKDTLKGQFSTTQVYIFENVKVLEVGINVLLPKMKAFFYKWLAKKAITGLKKQNVSFDIIHSHALLCAGIISPVLSEYFNKPLFHTEHSSGLIFNPNQFDITDRNEILNLIKTAKKIFFVSNYAKENSLFFKDVKTDKIKVLHNIVSEDFFKKKINERENKIIVIADNSPIKNHPFIIKSWLKIQDELSDYELVFAGNGFDTDEFKESIKQCKRLRYIPRLNRAEVLEQISSSKLLLSGSKLETFGLTVAEALAAGTPIVVTNSGGVRDIVENGDGFIVAQNDTDDFSKAIIKVINGQCDATEEIRERCRKKFSEEVIYGKLMEVYNTNRCN